LLKVAIFVCAVCFSEEIAMSFPRLRPRCAPTGLTLVEILVVISVVTILLALLLPAVQAAREAARRSGCFNNLRQFGLGNANHESVHGRLPTGRDAAAGRNHSWCTALLPFLEQGALHDRYDFQRPWDDSANLPVVESKLSVFLCPSAVERWAGKTDYGGNYGSALTGLTPGFRWGCAWEAGTFPPVHVAMIGAHRDSPVALSEVTDGTSHTFLVIENADRPAEEGGLWGSGHNCFAHDNGAINSNPSKEIFSRHPRGACALFCDGSVSFISDSTEPVIVGALCTRAAGEVIPF
jgi:type II secretory pathway pseudopilin PulG